MTGNMYASRTKWRGAQRRRRTPKFASLKSMQVGGPGASSQEPATSACNENLDPNCAVQPSAGHDCPSKAAGHVDLSPGLHRCFCVGDSHAQCCKMARLASRLDLFYDLKSFLHLLTHESMHNTSHSKWPQVVSAERAALKLHQKLHAGGMSCS